jgi:hypothetical protein
LNSASLFVRQNQHNYIDHTKIDTLNKTQQTQETMVNGDSTLVGTWEGSHLLNTPIRITFKPNHIVQFNEDGGIWHSKSDNNSHTLYMQFGTLLISNSFSVSENLLIIFTDRDSLILRKAQTPSTSPVNTDLLSLVQNIQNGNPVQSNRTAIYNDSWTGAPSMPKIYQNDHFGIHFSLPPTWFYSVADYLPVILSCLEPGMIIGRFYRPANEEALNHCYMQGYGERNVWFYPSFDSLHDISSQVFPKDSHYCKKVLHGYYHEQTGTLRARLLCLFSKFGDCFVFFGITSTNDKKFSDLSTVMDMISRSLTFSPPKANYAREAICGTYIDRNSSSVMSLARDFRFEWRCGGSTDPQYGTGSWDILGSDMEGEIHLHYASGYYKKVIYVVTSDKRITFDQIVYDVSFLI